MLSKFTLIIFDNQFIEVGNLKINDHHAEDRFNDIFVCYSTLKGIM